MLRIKVKLLYSDAKPPVKSGPLEACYDFHCIADNDFVQYGPGDYATRLNPGESHIFHTGVALAIPEGNALFLWDRSGMGAKRNVHRLAGVIDCTYRGEILVSLINLSSNEQIIHAGDKIIQGHVAPVLNTTLELVDELPESYRGEKGFGSTGR